MKQKNSQHQGPACLPAGKLVGLKDFAEKRSVASSQYVKIPAKWAGMCGSDNMQGWKMRSLDEDSAVILVSIKNLIYL